MASPSRLPRGAGNPAGQCCMFGVEYPAHRRRRSRGKPGGRMARSGGWADPDARSGAGPARRHRVDRGERITRMTPRGSTARDFLDRTEAWSRRHCPANGTTRSSCFQVIIPRGSGPRFKLSWVSLPFANQHHRNTTVSKQLHLSVRAVRMTLKAFRRHVPHWLSRIGKAA